MGKTRKVIRRPDYASGGITAEERKLLDAHTQVWLKRSMRTEAIEPETITEAIKQLYAVAGLKEPRVVIVPSPLVMKIAGGFASAIWQFRKNGLPEPIYDPTVLAGYSEDSIEGIKESNAKFHAHHINANAAYKATDSISDATTKASSKAMAKELRSELSDVSDVALRNAMSGGPSNSLYIATSTLATAKVIYNEARRAFYSATQNATDSVAHNPIANEADSGLANPLSDSTDNEWTNVWSNETYDIFSNERTRATDKGWAINLAHEIVGDDPELVSLMMTCAREGIWQNGMAMVHYDYYLTACRDVLGLRLSEHTNYAVWEQAAIHGSKRFIHDEFCMVSDFPIVRKVDEQNRAHCEDGPSHKWRDGYSLYSWHGVTLYNPRVVEAPETLTIAEIEQERNVEVRRVMISRFGQERFIKESGAKIIHQDQFGILFRKEIAGDEPLVMVKVINSTPEGLHRIVNGKRAFVPDLKNGKEQFKEYFLRVPPDIATAHDAVAWTFNMPAVDYDPTKES
jgi:hypothetical protein